ncbi:His Kinase A (phospho-acceptor) domain-containing protein [Spirosomataceae bacterium TFI 002]|nr:His Kinase A (phospho-acceptor) domain-containing protein [Spirosomataceae bacterium TFI 002]
MIKKWLSKYFFLLLSGILAVSAGVNYWVFEQNAPTATEQQYTSQIQENITEELTFLRREITEAGLKYQQSEKVDFSVFPENTKYPFYVFEDGKLVYWSDHRYTPSYRDLAGNYECKVITSNNKINLACRLEFKHRQSKVEVFGLIPLYTKYQNENEYLKSGYNEQIFSIAPASLKNTANDKINLNISDENGRFIFSIEPPSLEKLRSTTIPSNTLLILICLLIVLGLYLIYILAKLVEGKRTLLGLGLLIGYLLTFRWFTLANSIPFLFTESDLFNPKYFGINAMAPSLGDLIVNALCVGAVVLYFSIYYYQSNLYRNLLKASKPVKSIVSVILVAVACFITYYCFKSLTNIYEKSEYLLDYSLSVSYSNLKIGVLAFFIVLCMLFFLSLHVLISIFYRLNKDRIKGFFHWVYGVVMVSAILLILNMFSWIYLVVGLYFLIAYFFKLPRFFYNFRYKTSIYFFIGAFVFTLIAVEVIRIEEAKKEVFDKQAFGKKYLAENDFLGEGLMVRMAENIQKDELIGLAAGRDKLALEATNQLIRSNHLDLYFDKYDTDIQVFNQNGENLNSDQEHINLSVLNERYKRQDYVTDNPNIFFIDDVGNDFIKQYVVFVDVPANNSTIVLDFKHKDDYKESVYPELLMDKKLIQPTVNKNYSYGIYNSDDEILFSYGSFNYDKLQNQGIDFKSYNRKSFKVADYSHVVVQGVNDRYIIVSSKNDLWKKLLSDFSFLFLISVVVISLVILLYGLRYGLKRLNMNFSTKIQLYLNAAFLLPLILVIVITLSVIRSTLMKVQEKFYLENTKNTTSTIQLHLESYKNQKMSRAFFEQEMNELARETNVDINYFDNNGKLDFTTRPLIYDYFLLSRYINPDAFKKIIENHESDILLNESLGDLKYRAAYVNVRDRKNGSLGVISIPFFDAKTALDDQVSEVVNTILSVFILLFILLMIISYFASNQLTHPLSLITQKLRRTNLDKLNEPLEWNSDDEIGVLTKSYNKMILKLEESKDALSQSEKQSAWREMAKQVAHEIKNPLTPMKLSIQQLQRTLPSIDADSRKRIERALSSLTEQIDNISEIANSFSEFAKMPVPRSEVFNMIEIVRKTAYLYAQNNNIEIKIEAPEDEIRIRSDRQLINRVVTNLIINGIQSVPPTRLPCIHIKMYRNEEEKYAVIEVKDNGSGIPEDIRKKVFIPNFSTKVGGSGLGLAMAKRGIEHGGGNIWFETEEDLGTTFYVDIPLSI